MNENARTLYEDLKEGRLEYFNMRLWFCGTPQCIGGHAESRMPGGIRFTEGGCFHPRPEEDVAKWLGLTPSVGNSLFFPGMDMFDIWSHAPSPYDATQSEAAEALRKACEISSTEMGIESLSNSEFFEEEGPCL